MRLPDWGRRGLVGVDIGTGFIKAVAARGRSIAGWGKKEAPPAGEDHLTERAAALAEAVEESGFKGRRAVSALDGERVIVRYLQLPRMTEKELRSGLRYEADRYLPVGTQDMVLDCAILDPEPQGLEGQMLVLLAAAPRELGLAYYRLFQAAGLELVALDLVPLALCRALAAQIEGEALILDLGRRSCQVVLVRGPKLLYSRRINLGFQPGEQAVSPAAVNPLFHLPQEIGRSIEFYRSQVGSEFNPTRIYLTGGGAYQEGLQDFLRLELNLSVEISRPYGQGPEFAVAVGLALRESRV
ncbi:MAG: type IV pilus biogenesis protein PilM [Moorellaceae bacterium]